VLLAFALFTRGRNQDPQIVDAEILVDDSGCDDLAVRENFLYECRLDRLGAAIGLEHEDVAMKRKHSIGFDVGSPAVKFDGNFQRMFLRAR
jgi:hypothetical protein